MQPVITNWNPKNEYTTPLDGKPSYVNTGIIKAVMKTGEKISIAQIEYQEFDEENFQYVIDPYWEIIDGLSTSVFQGIPGINLDLRLNRYYRVNLIPTFITERTPSKNREDLWELLKGVGLDYYDRFEWLLRTNLRCANDNLIVERKRPSKLFEMIHFSDMNDLQYGDKIIVSSLEKLAKTKSEFNEVLFSVVMNGVDVVDKKDNNFINLVTRASLVPIVLAHKTISKNEYNENRKKGIESAKANKKYCGRKPIDVDENLLYQVSLDLDAGIITVKEAMGKTNIQSKSTFYRKLNKLNKEL